MSALPQGSQCMSTSAKSSSRNTFKNIGSIAIRTTRQTKSSLFRRLDIQLPWLKLIAVLSIGIIAILDLCDLTISHTKDPDNRIRTAPMSKHIRATERILEGKKLVALTFDDGPAPDTTPRLLDILTEKDAPATFFMLGGQACNYPDIVKRIAKEYHEVASHTMHHQNLIKIPAPAAESDINEAKSTIKNIIGRDPAYTRPPYGNYNELVSSTANTPLILWSVDTEDWRSKNTDAIKATTLSEVYDGAIILMHDIYPTSVDAVLILIDTLREQGYEFATISELATIRNTKLENGTAYYSFRP